MSAIEPPESIPNSEVKCRSTDGSVRLPYVRVGDRQEIFQVIITLSIIHGAVVQSDRIPACHAGGRGFETRPHRKKGHSSIR